MVTVGVLAAQAVVTAMGHVTPSPFQSDKMHVLGMWFRALSSGGMAMAASICCQMGVVGAPVRIAPFPHALELQGSGIFVRLAAAA